MLETGEVSLVVASSLLPPTLMDVAQQVTWWATRLGRQTTFQEWVHPGYTRKYGLNMSLIQENIDAEATSNPLF